MDSRDSGGALRLTTVGLVELDGFVLVAGLGNDLGGVLKEVGKSYKGSREWIRATAVRCSAL